MMAPRDGLAILKVTPLVPSSSLDLVVNDSLLDLYEPFFGGHPDILVLQLVPI